jgi:hypothetical protein
MRSGASGAGCLDASFAVSAMRARECRWYSTLSIIAPSVNVLRRTRRKPSTIRGAAPDVVIGQSTAARAGAHPYRAGEVARRFTASPPRTALKTANSSGDRRTTSPLYARRYASLPSFEPGGQRLTRSLGANAKAERCPGRFQQT